MKFKKIKYNIIFVTMFILIAGVLGIQIKSFINQPSAVVPNTSIEDNPSDNDNPNQNPSGDINDNQQDDPSLEDPSDEFDPKMTDSSFIRFPIKMLNYVLDKLYESEGYKATITMALANSANIGVGSVNVTQNVEGQLMKSSNKNYEYYEYHSKGYAGMGANYSKALYFEDDSVIEYITADGVYDITKANARNMTRADYDNSYGYALSDKPYLTYSSKNFSVKLVSEKTSNGKECYKLTAIHLNPSSVVHDYTKYFEITGDLKNTEYLGGTYTYYVYKDSGQIFRIQREENMRGTNPQFGVSVTTKITSTINITSFNKKIEINKPF